MFKIALILLGSRTIAKDWRGLLIFGAAMLLGGLMIIIDASDHETLLTLEGFGWILLAIGSIQTALSLRTRDLHGSAANRIVGNILVIAGLLITDFPLRVDIAIPFIFGAAFVLNGLFQMAAAIVIQFPRWRWTLMSGAGSTLVGILCFINWNHAQGWLVPLFLGVVMVLWGGSSILTALNYRKLTIAAHDREEHIFELKHFFNHLVHPRFSPKRPSEGDYARLRLEDAAATDNGGAKPAKAIPTTIIEADQMIPGQPLCLHIWTPSGTAGSPRGIESRNPVERYIAAVDPQGNMSTGHAALEFGPDLYISHYPETELALDPNGNLMDGLHCKDLSGKFLPNHAFEVADWMPPTITIRFWRFNSVLLHRFWEVYRQDTTYNLTNRNCSVTVALALDAAFSGVLKHSNSTFRLISLFADTDYWAAAFIRRKAEQMVWTPGLVMDYAIALLHVLEKH